MKYFSGPYTNAQLLTTIAEIETALTQRFDAQGPITDAAEQVAWRDRLMAASLGRNTVLFDDQGNPSIMVEVPLMLQKDLLPGSSSENPHPAFVVDGSTKTSFYYSKYLNIITGSGAAARALSLRGKDPRASIDFDTAMAACAQKGAGWHLGTNAEWSAIALDCKRKGFQPRGNNYYGKDYSVQSEQGIPSYISSDRPARTLTGSGPAAWNHDGTPFGIADLNGNVREWVGGLRMLDGEIQVLANNNAATAGAEGHHPDTGAWQALLTDGTLIAPGTEGTVKCDFLEPVPGDSSYPFKLTDTLINVPGTDTPYGTIGFASLTSDVPVPDLMKLLCLAPIDSDHGGDSIYMRNRGERLPSRGGSWNHTSYAGLFDLILISPRSYSAASIGFRSAFVQ